MRVLITGGAGFVGSHLAKLFRSDLEADVVVFDNLKRRGSELNLPEFKKLGIEFIHGDIRNPEDLRALPGNFDAFIEASAEPSVHAGVGNNSPNYLLDTNLGGSIHCLNFARERTGPMIFLSTSRVYSIAPLLALPLEESSTRLKPKGSAPGFSEKGISETFPTNTARSLYGATKLCSEYLVQEYVHSYKMKAVINRCGVIAGAGQFGKVDQGVFTLWMAHHYFQKPLQYTGFGGKGLQVRDLLHPRDLYALLKKQISQADKYAGEVFNVGGGNEVSTSLLEWTKLAQQYTGKQLTIGAKPETAQVDIPYYISDCSKVEKTFGWKPAVKANQIAEDICSWLKANESSLRVLFEG